MPRMVRKQVYIEERQEAALKRLAAERGVAEAEIVREAIDRAERGPHPARRPDPRAWDEFEAFLRKLRRRPVVARAARRWTRDDLYADRTERQR
jgi:hypothetical protein